MDGESALDVTHASTDLTWGFNAVVEMIYPGLRFGCFGSVKRGMHSTSSVFIIPQRANGTLGLRSYLATFVLRCNE